MLKKIFLFTFFLSTVGKVYALPDVVISYTTEEQESFSTILKKFVKDSSIINASVPFIQNIKNQNTGTQNWTDIPLRTSIVLSIPQDFLDPEKYNKYLQRMDDSRTGIKSSIFSMSSLGLFNLSSNFGNIKLNQNAPVSLGGLLNYFPQHKPFHFSTSLYISILQPVSNAFTQETVTIPPEIGGNIYCEYKIKNSMLSIYAGTDYERFSTFNFNALVRDRKIYVDNISTPYLTIGLSRSFMLFNKQFSLKAAISRSILTAYQNNDPRAVETSPTQINYSDRFNGNRFLLYLNYKFTEKIYFHSLFKYHSFAGPSKITSYRIGVGIGYNFL